MHREPSALDAVPAGLLLGWRTWELAKTADGFRLSSHMGPIWPTNSPLEAGCRSSVPNAGRNHDAPDPQCDCGIYARTAASDFAQCWRFLGTPRPRLSGPGVFGSLALGGRVIRYATGYRAQRAYPLAIILACSACWITGEPLDAAIVVEHDEAYPYGLQPRCRGHRSGPVFARAAEVQRDLMLAYDSRALDQRSYCATLKGPFAE